MVNKAKDYYKSHFKKDKTWHFLGHDLSEYPGTNQKYLELNKQKWDEYYACLKTQNDNLGPHRSVTPEAIQGFEGGSVSFDCKICLNPSERSKIDVVEWHWGPLNSKHLTPVEYTEHILLSPEDKILLLYNLHGSQTGQYICKLGSSLTAPYFLTVVDSIKNITEVHAESAKHGPYPRKADYISKYNLVLDTVWGDWSPCSKCGEVGKRHKLGYCAIIVQNQEEANMEKYENPTVVSTNETQHRSTTNRVKTKLKANMSTTLESEIPQNDLELLKIFKNGIPCLSHILPDSIKNLPQIKSRTSEVMTGFCKVPCSEIEVFEVKDKNGNVIEQANNSAGIYSMLQGMPSVEPSVERMLQYERMGEHIVISCPGYTENIQTSHRSTLFNTPGKSLYITSTDFYISDKAFTIAREEYSMQKNNKEAAVS